MSSSNKDEQFQHKHTPSQTPSTFIDITLQPTPSAFTLQPTPNAFTLQPTPSTFDDTRNPTPVNFIVPTVSPTYDNSWTLSDTFLVVGVILGLALILVLFLVYISPAQTTAKASTSNSADQGERDPLIHRREGNRNADNL